ncbi:hypothetical protein CCHR01_11869 [Colletotrichum chrysophilum]|uniref:Uncharacterized protein n=1 Tax=Colletotrichum chrysophilum TaxID=1836956 RepID=A0AAD9AH54_9PEZI|nr:hypothetical protein CCHR01_11869 [Colletotrichum chrysophilum]
MPFLGRLSRYGIDNLRCQKLWDLEIQRLRQLNLSAEEGLKPRIDPGDTFLQGKVEGKMFEDIESLARKVQYALFVCIVDDAVETQDYPLSSSAAEFALDCYRTLRRFRHRDAQPRVPGMHPNTAPIVYGPDRRRTKERIGVVEGIATRPRQTRVRKAKAGAPLEHKLEATEDTSEISAQDKDKLEATENIPRDWSHTFHYLVDQITATMAQIAITVSETFEGQTTLRDDSPIIDRHVQEHTAVSQWLAECINGVLLNLGDPKSWWEGDRFIDSCALVFDAGSKPTKTLLYQNNHGRISGSSDTVALSFSSVALGTVWKLSDMITSRTHNFDLENGMNNLPELHIELHLDLENKFTGKRVDKTKPPARIYSMIDYMILMIPLSLADPLCGEGNRNTLKLISSLSAFGVPTPHQIQIQGFVALKLDSHVVSGSNSKAEGVSTDSTPEIFISWRGLRPRNSDKLQFGGSSSLLTSFLLGERDCLLEREAVERDETARSVGLLSRTKFQLRKRTKSREKILEIARNWTIQEKAIVVPCLNYVIFVAVLTIVLVAGGMTCAFVVGERIPGVDPFNLTNFSWLVGGLSILLAKSLRVSEWTWRDFLLGRVSCRTVQELSDVTGLDPQDILAFLLSSEIDGILLTGGPFKKAFSRCSEIDGFSIDVKPNLRTLLASGIILIDVLTLEGPALLWLRLVPGYRGPNTVHPSSKGENDWPKVCKDPPRLHGDGDAVVSVDDSFSWIKILGVYNLKGVEFR